MLKIIIITLVNLTISFSTILKEDENSMIGEINYISISPNSEYLALNDVGNKQIKIYNLKNGTLIDKIDITYNISDYLIEYLDKTNRPLYYINIINEKVHLQHSNEYFSSNNLNKTSYSSNMCVEFINDSIIYFSVNGGCLGYKYQDEQKKKLITPICVIFKYSIISKTIELISYSNANFDYYSFSNLMKYNLYSYKDELYYQSQNSLYELEKYEDIPINFPIFSRKISDTSSVPLIYLNKQFINSKLYYTFSDPKLAILNNDSLFHSFGVEPNIYLNNKLNFKLHIKSENNMRVELNNIFDLQEINANNIEFIIKHLYVSGSSIYVHLLTTNNFYLPKYSFCSIIQEYSIKSKELLNQKIIELKSNKIKQFTFNYNEKQFYYIILNKNEEYEIKKLTY